MTKKLFIILLALCLTVAAMTMMVTAAKKSQTLTVIQNEIELEISTYYDLSSFELVSGNETGLAYNIAEGEGFHINGSVITTPESVEAEATIVIYASESDEYSESEPVAIKITTTEHLHVFDVSWSWSEDYSSCTVELSCQDDTYDQRLSATITSETITAATCTTDGEIAYTATVLVNGIRYSDTKKATIPAGHNYVDVVTTSATCGTDGVMTSTCSGCGDSYTAVIPATGEHDYAETVTDATCTENMKVGYFCMVCGTGDPDNPAEEIDGTALGHDWSFSDYQDATCTEGSYTLYECTRCDETYKVAGDEPATGHTEGEAVNEDVVEASCATDGSYDEVVYCTNCHEELSRETITVPATGHVTEIQNAKEATCTEDGYTGDEVCTVCQETVTSGEVIPATGHTEGEAGKENEVEASCTEAGSYESVVYCSVCSEEISRETVTVEATGHSYALGVCSVCGAKDPDYVVEVTMDESLAETLPSGLVTGATIRADLGSLTVSEVADDHLLQHIVDVMGFTLNNEAHGDWLLSETESFIIRTTENGRTALKKVTSLFYGDIDFASGAIITMELSGSEALASGTIYVLHYTNGDWQIESSTSSYADGKLTIEFQPDSASPFLIISVSDYTNSRNNILPLLLQIQSLNQTSTSEETTEEVTEEVVEIDEPVEAGETDTE